MEDNIPYPDKAEKAASISYIVRTGVRPSGGPARLWETARSIGLRGLFFGVEDCLFISFLLCLLLMGFSAMAAMDQAPIAPLLFLFSPALYASLSLLTAWKDTMSGTLEWKQTCRISAHTLTALRMLCFGAAAVIICVPHCLILWQVTGRLYSPLWMMSLSFSSLCLYATLALTLAVMRCHVIVSPLLWLSGGIALLCLEPVQNFLLQIPAVVFCLVTIAAVALLLAEMETRLARTVKGGLAHAVR